MTRCMMSAIKTAMIAIVLQLIKNLFIMLGNNSKLISRNSFQKARIKSYERVTQLLAFPQKAEHV